MRDGNLIFDSADSRNVSINLNGESRFLVNNVDVLKSLNPSKPSARDNSILNSLVDDVKSLKILTDEQRQIVKTLTKSITSNVTASRGQFERHFLNYVMLKLSNFENKLSNLTARLSFDHCESFPCQNGGSCSNQFDTFRCECPKSYEGPTCSIDADECKNYAGTDLGCQNGATCINTNGSYQ